MHQKKIAKNIYLKKKKRLVVAQIHNTEGKVKILNLKLAATKGLSKWKLHTRGRNACKKKMLEILQQYIYIYIGE